MDDCMNALEENERQTNAVWDSNFREANMGIVQQQGCRVVLASTTRPSETSGVKDVVTGTSSSSTNQLTEKFGRMWADVLQKMLNHAHDGVESKTYTQYIATDGLRCYSGTAATVSALKLA